ncbi:MAG: ribosome small subunit-dependent GTPase A [Burkholderiales bacterium]|nr:ribosome small subunit-dependent GTPase A [Burkholderiales bacterium]
MSVDSGTVVATFGRQHEVETRTGARLECVTRGRRQDCACGDEVAFRITSPGQGVIEAVLPRRTYLERADRFKRKAIAANADQVLILTAVEPPFSDEFVMRVTLLAHAAGIGALIALNKIDLPALEAARTRLAPFASAGHRVLEVAIQPRDSIGSKTGAALGMHVLKASLEGRATVLAGQSGMGKSSLVNALVPDAGARIGDISSALNAGRHTTTFSRLYRIDDHTTLIDCPGMQEVGLANLTPSMLDSGFADLAPFMNHCRFADCRHDKEPGCALQKALADGYVHHRRFELYTRLRDEVTAARAAAY